MKILFVNPSLRRNSATKYLPVGVAAVMTFVRDHGYEFDLLDIDVHDYSDEHVERFLTEHEYDVVLAGCIVTHYKWMKWLTRTIKKHHPHTLVVIGNSVGGSIPELFITRSAADVVVIGEGEFATLDVLDARRAGRDLSSVEGIAFKAADGSIVKNPRRKATSKIDDLPIIDWDLFEVSRYFEKSYAGAQGLVFEDSPSPRVMPVSSARGCIFKCTFCHYVFWDDPYRYRSAESILKEIDRNISKYGATYINFWDDLSFGSLYQAERLVDAILASGLKFNWNAAVRVDLFGSPRHPYEKRVRVAEKFKEAGCLSLGFSLESGNQEILDMMNKKIEARYFYDQIKVLKEVGLTSSTSLVFGYPIETPETIQQTFEMCLTAGVYPSIGFLLPLPYTGMYEYAKEHGFIADEDRYLDSITERQDLCLNMTSMSDDEVMGRIKDGAARLNEMLQIGLTNETLIRTGGYRRHTKKTAQDPNPLIDPENLKRNENDVSFNYSQAIFDVDLGVEKRD